MPGPNFPSDGQGDRTDALVTASNAANQKLGIGSITPAGGSQAVSWAGVATHAGGAAVGGTDGVVVAGGADPTTAARALLSDQTGTLAPLTYLAPPTGVAAVQATGTLGAGTYYYRVSALTDAGESLAAAEVAVTIAATHGVTVTWNQVPGATGYKVYGRSTGAELYIATVTPGTVLTYTDSGSITPAGALPTTNTARMVQSVEGLAASGSAVTGNPVLVAGSDGTNARTLATDATGQVKVTGTVTTTPPANASTNLTQIGGAAIAEGAALSAASLPVVLSTDGTVIGPVNETAPASDTASSGLNGRLQRIAQRLTSIIALLPTALGTGGGLKIGGDVAVGTADNGAPISIGGIASASPTIVTEGQRVAAWINAMGALIVGGDYIVGENWANAAGMSARNAGGINTAVPLGAAGFLWDGVGWNAQRSNTGNTLIASATFTATFTTADQTNHNGRGVELVVDVTAVSGTTPTLVVALRGKDPASGKYYTILASATINAISTTVLHVYPGLVAAANSVANAVLPLTWDVNATIGGTTPSFTMSIGASVIL